MGSAGRSEPAAGGRSQLAPGTIVAGRYRISGLLGSGGMGEVYRADDLKLEQAVALKFLPPALAHDAALLEKLHSEVRLGRQVAHPNVCRIYDIADWGESRFVAMEYVDGEDLARLLRRIGRLPNDKAVEIARGIAAGLAAAHAKGILHRDLKPANIMIDGHGEARITDFGLALPPDAEQEDIAGTPAYMAPEQLIGRAASVRSDIYALGLVMYEIFTGKRVYTGNDVSDLRRQHEREIAAPSAHVRDIDKQVEAMILRCLARDPEQRPRSVREVYESLPGGDPLAAALAAGETPSPRAVAAAGTEGSLSPAKGWALVALIVVLLSVIAAAHLRVALLALIPLDKPPVVLEQQAVDVAAALGLPRMPYRVVGFETQKSYLAWIGEQDRSETRWNRLRRGLPALTFWTRFSPAPIPPPTLNARPSFDDPPFGGAGSIDMQLDTTGRLFALRAALPNASTPARPPDWRRLLAEAGFDPSKLTAAPVRDTPRLFADARAAWDGAHPDDGTPVHLEAAAARGTPVYFRTTGKWENDDLSGKIIFGGSSFEATETIIIAMLTVIGIVLAGRNFHLRRGDRRGGLRLAILVFTVEWIAFVLGADHHVVPTAEGLLLADATSVALFWALAYYVLYMALEPYVRRRWPERLISWSRLLSGEWRDPMVGRDVLIGVAGGLAHTSIALLTSVIVSALRLEPPLTPYLWRMMPLLGMRQALAHVVSQIDSGIIAGLGVTVILVTFTILLRRRSLGVAALTLFQIAAFAAAYHGDRNLVPFGVAIAILITFIAVRFGLLAIAVVQLIFGITFHYPLLFEPSQWTFAIACLPVAAIAAIVFWAFKTSLGGQPLFSRAFFAED
jgi:eukaryotic-like serine/threonine-protein kinase